MDAGQTSASDELLERDDEHASIVAVLDAAAKGNGGTVAVVGPAGIGKTRLLDLAQRHALVEGATVAMARGGSLEMDIAYGAVRQLLEPLVRTAGDPASLFAGGAAPAAAVVGGPDITWPGTHGADGPGAVLHALYWLTVGLAERRPVVLLCDDAHWFDAASLRYLAYLNHRVGDVPVAIVIGSRPPEPGPAGELLQRLLDAPGVERLRPAPLSRDAVGDLVRRTLPGRPTASFCDAVADASRGNPFLVGELLRAASDESRSDGVPAFTAERLADLDIDDAVLARIGRLPPDALEVATAVAVLGADAHLRHVASLTGLTIGEAGLVADQLLRADILGPDRPLAFVHPVVESAVAGRLLPGERSERHRRALAVLRAEGVAPERLAPHLMALEPAADPDVVDALLAAAASALRTGATEQAIAQLRRALAEPPPADRRQEIVLRLGIAESLVNDPAAIEHLGQAVDDVDDVQLRLTLSTARAVTMTMAGRWGEAMASLRRLEPELGPNPVLHTRLLAGMVVASTVGRVPAVELDRLFGRLMAAVPADEPHPSTPPEVLAARAYAGGVRGEAAAAVAHLAECALAAIDEADPSLPLWFHLAAAALTMADRDLAALTAIERRLSSARRDGAPTQVAVMLFQRGVIGFRAGELDDAEADARASLELCTDYRLDFLVPAPLSVLLDVLRERDELAAADEALAAYGYDALVGDDPRFGQAPTCQFDLLLLFARGRLRGAQERWDDSAGDLDAGWALAQASGCVGPGFIAWQANRAHGRVFAGQPGDAVRLSLEAYEASRAFGAPRPLAEAERAMILTGAATGEDAARMLAAAMDTFRELGAPLEEARTAATIAYAVGVAGTPQEIEALARAHWLAERSGAVRLAALFRARQKLLGAGRSRYRPVSGVASLTASERRVAMLASTGLTNKAIAQELYVSVKTVETHLARSFQKLGISSRAELGAALTDVGAA